MGKTFLKIVQSVKVGLKESEQLGCSITELKKRHLTIAKLSNMHGGLLDFLSVYKKRSVSDSEKYNIEKTNSINALYFKWQLELIEEEEKLHAEDEPITDESPSTLLMKFSLESDDEVLILQKFHLYHKKYPWNGVSLFLYRRNVENDLDKIVENGLKPIIENQDLKKDTSKYNLAIDLHLTLIEDAVKEMDGLTKYIEECNKQYISFYVELDLAIKRAKQKYKL